MTTAQQEAWARTLANLTPGSDITIIQSPELLAALNSETMKGTHYHEKIGERHVRIARLNPTPVAFTDKLPMDKAFDRAEANVLAVTNTEATECKCRAAAHREKDIDTLLPLANTALAHSMLADAMAKPSPAAETMEKISDLLETLTLKDRQHFLDCLYDEQPEAFAVVADRVGGGA